jgi:hypothetical protein
MKPNPELILKLAALTHVGLAAAGLMMWKATGLRAELAKLAPFPRRLFCTYYVFIALCVVAFGLGSWFLAPELAASTPLARAVCGFLTAFWTIRLVAAAFVFDVRPYLTNGWWRLGYHATNVVFSALPFAYAWLALR